MLVQVGELFAQFLAPLLLHVAPGLCHWIGGGHQGSVVAQADMWEVGTPLDMGVVGLIVKELLVQSLRLAFVNLKAKSDYYKQPMRL